MTTDRERKKVGRLGEDEACAWLSGAGHTILDRNWRSGHLELDIVTMDSRGIHFVEVKTRRPPMQAAPQDSVGYEKQRRMTVASASYLRKKDGGRWSDMEVFFDVVTVVFDKEGMRVEYFPQAFIPMYFGK